MGNVMFAQAIGRTAKSTGKVNISSEALDHALNVAQRDAQASHFKANAASSKEIAALYNSAVKDGRYVGELASNPADVAKKLNVTLSSAAAKEMTAASKLAGVRVGGGGLVEGSVTVVCIAVVVVLCADTGPEEVVVDRSGMLKY
jgi:hypothetical protein